MQDVVSFLTPDKGEQLVHLNGFKGDIADALVEQPGALLAYHFQDGQHGVTMDAGEPFNGAHAHTFNQQVRNLHGLFKWHAQIVQRTGGNV
jgi:hypothetical protein